MERLQVVVMKIQVVKTWQMQLWQLFKLRPGQPQVSQLLREVEQLLVIRHSLMIFSNRVGDMHVKDRHCYWFVKERLGKVVKVFVSITGMLFSL